MLYTPNNISLLKSGDKARFPVSPHYKPTGILTNLFLSKLSAKNSLEPKASKQLLTNFNRWISGLKATGFNKDAVLERGKKKLFFSLKTCTQYLLYHLRKEAGKCSSKLGFFFFHDGKGNTSRQGQMITYAYSHNILVNTGTWLLVFWSGLGCDRVSYSWDWTQNHMEQRTTELLILLPPLSKFLGDTMYLVFL